jgi:uncharacterized RDD family membrane protein YckC
MENRVGFWPRVAAFLIDFALVAGLSFLLKGLAQSLLPTAYGEKLALALADPRTAPMKGFITTMTGFAVAAALLGPFYGLIEGVTGRSPGKMLVGLRVVDEAGQVPPLGTLLVRYLVKTSSSLIAFAALFVGAHALDVVSQVVAWGIFLGFFLVLTKSRQALHDKIAGTAVLRKADVHAPALSAPA